MTPGPTAYRLVWLLSVLVVLSVGLAACADDADPDATTDVDVETDDDDVDTATGEAAEFFEGETLTYVISYGEGGYYDTAARAMAPHLEEYLGANVVVENQPGAGGLLAMNSLFASEPDGLTVGVTAGQGLVGSVLGEAEGVQFDLLDFSFVARTYFEDRVLGVGADSEFQTIEQIMDGQGFRFASTGPGGADHLDANVLFEALDIDGDIITGYDGSAATALAVTSGEAHGASGAASDRLQHVATGDWNAALVIGTEPHEEVPDVPVIVDLDLDEESRELVEAHVELAQMGGMLLAPPDVPEDRLEVLRDAFEYASTHEDFLAEMGERDLATGGFARGDEYQAITEQVLDSPEAYTAVVREAYAEQ